MRSHPVATAPAGDFVTPNEFSAEVAEIVSVLHSLDHDNFPANEILTANCELGAFGGQLVDGTATTQTVQHTIDAQIGDVYAIPNAAGTAWKNTVTVGDCVLEITLSTYWHDDTSTDPCYVWIGIRVDGDIIVKSPTSSSFDDAASPACFAYLPVEAGEHTIECVYGIHPATTPFARGISWEERVLSVIEHAR